MLRPFFKLLPWFVVAWVSRRYGERFEIGSLIVVQPFRNGPVLSLEDFGPGVDPPPPLASMIGGIPETRK